MTTNPSDDAHLIEQIAAAQPEALDELYDRYHRLVYSVTLTIVGDPPAAEELTLDVFVHAWRGAKTYRPERAKVSTWLLSIARHRAIDYLRWRRSRPDVRAASFDDAILLRQPEAFSPESRTEASLLRDEVHKALRLLPVEQRQALMLAYFRGYSHQQIADVLRQPLGTIKTRIRMAMQKLRQQLQEIDGLSDKSKKAQASYMLDEKKD